MEPTTTAAPAVAPPVNPFSAGEVIRRSFSIWFRNLGSFSLVALTIWIPAFLVAGATPPRPGLGRQLFLGVVSSLSALVATGALTFGVLQALRGTRVAFRELLATGMAKLGRVFGASFFTGVIVGLGTLLLVVPGVIAACGLYVTVPAVVVEDGIGASDSLSRSWELTRGHRWAIFLVGLVVMLVRMASATIGTIVLLAGAVALPGPVPLLAQTALTALVAPLAACTAAVAYHDLRVAKEGVDTAALVKVFE
jgi:hypothetical protein